VSDARIETPHRLIGVESKRYEPFRTHGEASFSDAYWRPVWGERMSGYCAMRDRLRYEPRAFAHLDAAQLVKHAFGLRTGAMRRGVQASLLYVFAEPQAWPDGRPIAREAIDRHRAEAAVFAEATAGDEVTFHWICYRDLLEAWRAHPPTRAHAEAVLAAFMV
jgi:hypothetical protein